MRRWCILALLACQPMFGAIALVAHVGIQGTATASRTTTAINTTGANFLVLVQDGGTTTPNDSKSNSWTCLTDHTYEQICYVANPTVGASHTFTCNGYYSSLAVMAFSGMATSSVFDAGTDKGAAAAQPGSITPPSGPQLVVSGCKSAASGAHTVNSGFTVTDDEPGSGGVSYGVAGAYLIQTPNGSAVNPTWTNYDSTNIAAFAGAAAGAAANVPMQPVWIQEEWQ